MIEREKERYGWEFLFLGANRDAVQEAVRFGIGADRAGCCAGDADLCRACICYCPREAIEYGKGVPVYEKSSEYVMKEGASVTGPSKHLCTIGRQLEGRPQHICSTAAHQHPLQENFKVFVHAANVGVDLQIQ